jgi:hypothetical protein
LVAAKPTSRSWRRAPIYRLSGPFKRRESSPKTPGPWPLAPGVALVGCLALRPVPTLALPQAESKKRRAQQGFRDVRPPVRDPPREIQRRGEKSVSLNSRDDE